MLLCAGSEYPILRAGQTPQYKFHSRVFRITHIQASLFVYQAGLDSIQPVIL